MVVLGFFGFGWVFFIIIYFVFSTVSRLFGLTSGGSFDNLLELFCFSSDSLASALFVSK